MKRSDLKVLFDHSERLKIVNPEYCNYLDDFFGSEMALDLGDDGDVTTEALFGSEKRPIKGEIIAKAAGCLAGLEEVRYFLKDFELESNFSDGDHCEIGDTVLSLYDSVQNVLAAERLALNVLMRMSGIATLTEKAVNLVANKNVIVLPTRKTLWRLLDKKAVSIGGGGTHRLGLHDAILSKDTHKDLLNGDFNLMLLKLMHFSNSKVIEIEVENLAELRKLADAYQMLGLKHSLVVMLDNFDIAELKEATTWLESLPAALRSCFVVEASGGVKLSNLKKIASTGVDAVSMSFLTMEAQPLDMSLKIKKA